MRSLNKCLNEIKNSKNIAIICHTLPDADALCSAVALKKLIKQNINDETKQIDIFVDADEISDINNAIIKNFRTICEYLRKVCYMENKFRLVLTRGKHKHPLMEKKQSLICSWISEVQTCAFIFGGLCPFLAFKTQK